MTTTFFDKNGAPIAYSEDQQHIFTFSGKPIAYFDGDSIISFSGSHIGWFEDGWVRDHGGNCVYFTDEAVGGPFKPFKQFMPFKSFKEFMPIKSYKEVKPFKAVKTLNWSPVSMEDFFKI